MDQILDTKELLQTFATLFVTRAPKILIIVFLCWIAVRMQSFSSSESGNDSVENIAV